MAETTPLDLERLRQQLNRYSCLAVPPPLAAEAAAEVRAALLVLNELSDYQTLGVCAETLAVGKAAADAYITALGTPVSLDLPEREGPVYIKFNTLRGAWYLDSYGGGSRGVLITFHSGEVEAVNGTYGPFPLDLFG